MGDEHRFVTVGELDEQINRVYKSAKGQNFIEKVSNFLGSGDADIILSDVNGDGLLKIEADGLIWVDTTAVGSGFAVGTYEGGAKNGWLMYNAGLFSWSGNTELHAFILDTITWQGISAGTGDAFIGDYTNGAGLWFDKAPTPILHIAGDLALESIPGFPSNQLLTLDVEFTEGYGTIVHDGSKSRVTGTASGAPAWANHGFIGKTLGFVSASSQFVTFPHKVNAWDILGSGNRNMAWKIPIWIASYPASAQVVWSKGRANVAGWYVLLNTDGRLQLRINKSGSQTICATTDPIPTGQWVYVLFCYTYGASDSGLINLWINAEEDTAAAKTSVVTMVSGSAYDMYFGCYDGSTYFFDGWIQGAKLWNGLAAVLTANEVKALYKYAQGARGGQLTARSVMVGTVSTTTGFIINDTGIWSYIGGIQAKGVSLANDIAWQRTDDGSLVEPIDAAFELDLGDEVFGGYNYQYPSTGEDYGGILYDLSARTFTVRGALVTSAIVPAGGYFEYNANIVFPDQGGSNFGIAFTDGSGDQIGVIGCDSTNWLSTGWDGMAIATLGIPSVNYDLIFCSRLGSDSYAEDGACYVFHSPYATTGTKEAFILPSIDSARDGTKIYGVHLGAQNYKFLGLWVRDGGKVEIGDATYPFVINIWNGASYDASDAYIS
jgi:hypothetical protein